MSNRSALFLTTFLAAAAIAGVAPAGRADAAVPARLAAIDRGPTNASTAMTITVHLTMPNEAEFHQVVANLYDPASPTFHKWLSDADLKQFAPSEAQRDAVRQALQAAGLTIIGTDKNGFSIRARGAAGNVARAFNTEIHDFERNGEMFRANVTPPHLGGGAAAYVKTVAGLESHIVHPMLSRAIDFATGKPPADIPLSQLGSRGSLSSIVTSKALSPTATYAFKTPGHALPKASYTGVVYDANPNLVVDFDPAALEAAYGLPAVYKKGWTGAGQTIVLLEGYGYPTIESDANADAKLAGLPQLTSSNFSIVYPEGVPSNPNIGIITGWNIEIALDVQSSHSIAPDANILVVATNGQDNEDFQASMQYIIDNDVGSAVSDSWEQDLDLEAGPDEQQSYETLLEQAAAKGISFQFSSGDSGDNGVGSPLGAPGVPSVAPHATAVGGTAIVNTPGSAKLTPVAWGDGISAVASAGPISPPSAEFYAGGGGGESVYWPKPSWQSKLPGSGREVPDVSALADPFTGFPLVITQNGTQDVAPGWGGTSLASPIFTAYWVIAQQAAGGALGQAAPTLAKLKKGLTDVVQTSFGNNISGSVTTSSGTTDYTTADIFTSAVIEGNTTFIGSLWKPAAGVGYGFAFGLDSSLTAGPGWDNATGYGTPDGLAFIEAVVAASKATK